MAVNSIAGALGNGISHSFATDNDIALVGEALPFCLKTMEAILSNAPDNKELCLSLVKGFVLYAYAYVETKSDKAKDTSVTDYQKLRYRAGTLYYRAYDYGMKGLALSKKNFLMNIK